MLLGSKLESRSKDPRVYPIDQAITPSRLMHTGGQQETQMDFFELCRLFQRQAQVDTGRTKTYVRRPSLLDPGRIRATLEGIVSHQSGRIKRRDSTWRHCKEKARNLGAVDW